jgi:L-asparaginase
MIKPRLLVLSLGGTITMVPSDSGGIAPKLGAAELVASVPSLADVAEIEAHSPFRLPSPSLTSDNLVEVARTIEDGFASGFDGAVVIQGTDTIEESAFILDLLVGSEKPVVVTGAMRGADAPGADGPANLLAAARVAAAPEARGLGTLAVLNYDIHAARFVQKSHTTLPSAFSSPLVGPIWCGHRGAASVLCPRDASADSAVRRWSPSSRRSRQMGHGRRRAHDEHAARPRLCRRRRRRNGCRACAG